MRRRLAGAFSALTGVAIVAALALWLWHGPETSSPGPLPPLTGPVDRIEIDKSARRLTLWRGSSALRSYAIALGREPVGDKLAQGDGRTPEGRFRINRRNPHSRYHLSLGLDYPQAEDIRRAAALGVSPGGDIFIHGQPNDWDPAKRLAPDWTAGCIALDNAAMEELWRVAEIGTEVIIRP